MDIKRILGVIAGGLAIVSLINDSFTLLAVGVLLLAVALVIP
jgi:type IV secretory pathway VirB3-like protein